MVSSFLGFAASVATILTFFIAPATATFTEPVRAAPGGSDPQIVYSGGYFYLLTTTWTDVEITRATTIEGLADSERTVLFSTTEPSYCCNVWAPEAHLLGDSWYIYYVAGETTDLDGQRIHVLKGGDDLGDYTAFEHAAQLTTAWSIDPSIIRFSEYGNFLMTSCFEGVSYQSICLQQLGDDYISVTGDIYVISQPTESWETEGTPVNEGPNALYMNGVTYIGYSASYCWTQYYCLGLLTWDGTTDPTDSAAWTKADGCQLASANGNYGTGGPGFFQSPDGSETWITYHATSSSAGACDDTRYTMAQVIGLTDEAPAFPLTAPESGTSEAEPSGE